jgi:hypothetical protein
MNSCSELPIYLFIYLREGGEEQMGKIQIIAKASFIKFTTKIMIESDMGETLTRRVGDGSKIG